jgi:hypothetical protein
MKKKSHQVPTGAGGSRQMTRNTSQNSARCCCAERQGGNKELSSMTHEDFITGRTTKPLSDKAERIADMHQQCMHGFNFNRVGLRLATTGKREGASAASRARRCHARGAAIHAACSLERGIVELDVVMSGLVPAPILRRQGEWANHDTCSGRVATWLLQLQCQMRTDLLPHPQHQVPSRPGLRCSRHVHT